MATSERSVPAFFAISKSKLHQYKIGIVVSEWNEEITGALYDGAYSALVLHGIKKDHIVKKSVPGSFELTLGAQYLAMESSIDAVICLGCVIQGQTRHFEFICQSVSQGLKDVALKFNKPVIFGVLTTDTRQQALDRAGGKYGNKGEESALAALKMLAF